MGPLPDCSDCIFNSFSPQKVDIFNTAISQIPNKKVKQLLNTVIVKYGPISWWVPAVALLWLNADSDLYQVLQFTLFICLVNAESVQVSERRGQLLAVVVKSVYVIYLQGTVYPVMTYYIYMQAFHIVVITSHYTTPLWPSNF